MTRVTACVIYSTATNQVMLGFDGSTLDAWLGRILIGEAAMKQQVTAWLKRWRNGVTQKKRGMTAPRLAMMMMMSK